MSKNIQQGVKGKKERAMDFKEYIFYREIVARIKYLPGALDPIENEILAAVSQALRVFDKEASLEETVRKMLRLKDLGQINILE